MPENGFVMKQIFALLIAVVFFYGCQESGNKANFDDLQPSDIQPFQNEYAESFEVTAYDSFLHAKVKSPWQGADRSFGYQIPKTESFSPSEKDNAVTVASSPENVVCLSSTCIVMMHALGLTDKISGISGTDITSVDEVIEKAESGKIRQTGDARNVDLEQVIDLEPDLVITFGSEGSNRQVLPKLQETGINVVYHAEFLENAPLARAEWIRFFAAFFDKADKADSIFQNAERYYHKYSQKIKDSDDRPSVITGKDLSGTWYVPGGKNYQTHFIRDAGGAYVWEDTDESGSLSLSFEEVYDKGADAEFWLINAKGMKEVSDLYKEDTRYEKFRAFREGNLYNTHGGISESGAYPYWDKGVINPHLILADLISVFHPEKMPEHELEFYRKLKE